MLILNKNEIKSVITMEEAIEAIEEGFQAKQQGKAGQPPNYSFIISEFKGRLNLRAAWLSSTNLMTTKINTNYSGNPTIRKLPAIHSVVLLNSLETGEVLALLEGSYLTALRTGATTGVATKFLSREDANVVGIIGAGYQAEYQIEAICSVRRVEKVKIYDIDMEKARKLAVYLTNKLETNVVAVQNSRETITKSDICVTVTTSKKPVFSGDWIGEGMHINAIGTYVADRRELDTATVQKGKLVVDSMEHCLKEAGDILIPINEGKLAPRDIYCELGEIITREKPGRTTPEEITLFKSVGIGVQDAAVSSRIYYRAKEQELGKEVAL